MAVNYDAFGNPVASSAVADASLLGASAAANESVAGVAGGFFGDGTVGSIAEFAGLDFIGLSPADLFASIVSPTSNIAITVPGMTGGAGIMNLPNYSVDMNAIAINTAATAASFLELALAIQNIVDPAGGLVVKDALDAYHVGIVKNALEEAGEPVPIDAKDPAFSVGTLGGELGGSGALAGISSTIQGLAAFGKLPFLDTTPIGGPAVFPTPAASPGVVGITGFLPNYAYSMKILASSMKVINWSVAWIASGLKNSIDAEAGALVLRSVLDNFTAEVSGNALAKANKTNPNAVTPSSTKAAAVAER